MHPLNSLLPSVELSDLQRNDLENWNDIQQVFSIIDTQDDVVDSKVLGRLIRLMETRMNLKYANDVDHLSRYSSESINIYSSKRISIPMKIKLLRLLARILKYRKYGLNITIHWRVFWDEILEICTRATKHESIGCETLNSKLFESLIHFVHEARCYFPAADALEIAHDAMTKLADLRHPMAFLGLQQMVLCLPTDFSDYDMLMPRWVEIFSQITDNDAWDACWLTLFCRARKYTSTFCWSSIKDMLYVKMKELLQFPTSKGRSHLTNGYPTTFPLHISALKVSPMDYRKSALKKIVKLIYASCFSGEIMTAQPISVTPPAHARDLEVPGMNRPAQVHSGAAELVGFMQFNRAYFYPSNIGQWTADVGYLLLTLTNEMGQHMGQSLLKTKHFAAIPLSDAATSVARNTRDLATMTTMHTDTMRYLCGALTSVALEGLYGKSSFMIQTCNFCLRNICCIDPSLGHVVMPFLLSALHPDAVNQSHMAPASMTAISSIFKALLFPRPVMLLYLEELLQLSLAGIDPSDPQKTLTTMSMYNSVFTWFPVNTCSGDSAISGALLPPPLPSMDDIIPPSYLSIVAGDDLTPACSAQEYYDLFQSSVAPVLAAWAPRFTEKVLAVMDAKEQVQKGKQSQSPMVSYIEESFFGVMACVSDDVRVDILRQVIEFCRSSHAFNAAKEIGKLLESLLTVQPSLLPVALEQIVDEDVQSGNCSTEKLSLRLRLVGACLRRTGGDTILANLDKLAFANNDAYKFHSDKSVRKAVCKLTKDLLKGMGSFYTLHPTGNRQPIDAILGRPNHAATVECTWHVPSASCASAVASLLRCNVTGSMEQIESMLTADTSSGSATVSEAEGASDKQVRKAEDKIVSLLHLIRRSLRGAAEILGDLGDKSSPVEGDMEVDLADDPSANLLIATGRSHVFQSVSAEDALYLTTLRHTVVSFLNRVQSLFEDSSSFDASASSSPAAGYANSPSVRSVLLKILKVTVCQRMAVLKNIDNVKKWFAMSRRMVKSSTVQYMERKLQRVVFGLCLPNAYPPAARRGDGIAWTAAIGTPEYWIGHDLCPRTVCDRVWIQQVLRLKALSFNATNSELRRNGASSQYYRALQLMASTCGHEYDAIRSKANKLFQDVSSRFGWRIESIISTLLQQLSTPGTSYAVGSGALSILSMDLVLKRIAGTWRLQDSFLRSLRAFPTMLVSIEESDKREKLANKMSGVFARYLGAWHHNPMQVWTGDGPAPASELIASYLSDFGVSAGQDSDAGGATGTLRHQMYLASVVLTFTGHDDVFVPVGVWEWALSSLRTDHGQPLQTVALAALTKLACVQSRASESAPVGVADIVRATLASPVACTSLLQGLLHCHKSGGAGSESAQWSRGIDSMFRNAEYICNVLPRQSTAYSERCTFSSAFRATNAFLIYQLLSILCCDTNTVPTVVVSTLLAACKGIVSTNEEEARGANATRAEVCCGVMRFLTHREAMGCGQAVTSMLWLECVSFLNENTQRISIDYCCDYAECVAFGLGMRPNSSDNAVCAAILGNAAETFVDGAACDEGPGASSSGGDNSSNGFTRHAKHLLLLRALLVTDISAVSCYSTASTRISAIGVSLHKIITEKLDGRIPSFASPYLVLRVEMSKLLATLAEYDASAVPLRSIIDKLISECSGPRQNGSVDTMETGLDSGGTDITPDSAISDVVADTWKLACDTVCRLLETFLDSSLLERYADVVCSLVSCALEGCGHPELEFSKHCHQVCLKLAQTIKNGGRSPREVEGSMGLLADVLGTFLGKANHPSLHVRETVVLSLGVLLANNYPVMSAAEKKLCKDAFAQGFQDGKPEVQVLSVAAMTTYLGTKSMDELSTLAAAYIKNSDILAARERKKRKATKDNGSSQEKPDAIYMSTVRMSACMILLFPYDLPHYLAALLTSFVRHASTQAVKETVVRTVQEFKRTHQDRWDEFKHEFTPEQLEDLQGAGAAHYFS